MSTNTTKVRALNTELIRGFLKNRPDSTKAVIAEGTGLSYSTCGNILRDLVNSSEVLVTEGAVISGGRPAAVYRYNTEFNRILCLYITEGSTHPVAVCAVYNPLGELVAEEMVPMPLPDSGSVLELLLELRGRHPRIGAVSLGLPAVVTAFRAVGLCDFPALQDIPLAQHLEEKLGVPVVIENDVNLTALGFSRALAGARSAVVVYFPRDSHPGSGIVINGQIVRGFSNFAGEVSYLPTQLGKGREDIPGSTEAAIRYASLIISAMACTVNPELALLTGPLLNQTALADVRRQCENHTPREHLPQLLYRSDTKDYYQKGLWTVIQQRLTGAPGL